VEASVKAIDKVCRRAGQLEFAETAHGLVEGRRVPGRWVRSREEKQTFGELLTGAIAKLVKALCTLDDAATRLGPHSTFLDVGSGFGQVVLQVSVRVPGAHCVGVELVPSRIEGARNALWKLREAGLPLSDVVFYAGDVCELLQRSGDCFSHIYAFDYSFDEETLQGLADVLHTMPFAVLASFHPAAKWTDRGLCVRTVGKIQPAGMARCNERHTLYLLANVPSTRPKTRAATVPRPARTPPSFAQTCWQEYLQCNGTAVLSMKTALASMTGVSLTTSLQYLVQMHTPIQVLYVQNNMELVESSPAFDALCELLQQGSIWAVNIGDVPFTPEQYKQLRAALRTSRVAFIYVCDTHVSKEDREVLKDITRGTRRSRNEAPWVLGDNEAQNNVIRQCTKMFKNPMTLGINKAFEAKRKLNSSFGRLVDGHAAECLARVVIS
jgi:SAM-dependent methyltransferase